MELADIGSRSKFLLSLCAPLANLQLPDLVCQGLSRPNNVAIHFHSNVLIGFSGIFFEKLHRLLARPAHRMHSGVHDEPNRAPHFVAELPEFRVRIFVHAELFAEALRIQCPALDKRRVSEVFPEFRHVFHLLPERKLKMMPGYRFMQRERFHFPLWPRVKVKGVDEIAAWPPRARCTRLV